MQGFSKGARRWNPERRRCERLSVCGVLPSLYV